MRSFTGCASGAVPDTMQRSDETSCRDRSVADRDDQFPTHQGLNLRRFSQLPSDVQEIKMEADTVVDSITASDIGAFPDKSVAEALQRVTGITVSRFAAPGVSTHFSAEPAGVIIRGLPALNSISAGKSCGLATR